MTWQAELTIDGAVDETWSSLTDEQLFRVYNCLLQEADKEGWRGQLAWWPDGQAQNEWADQPGGTHVIAPGMAVA